ncbi:Transmembrane protein [Phytophthora megakarya]|uniref:Transmembrane protein n=1 Tax=Phytophthora megakarya TaxID=4795 RepID=A0A225WKG4_9STRA|nr:Transmembrane protein [Phytophthora megakarya]
MYQYSSGRGLMPMQRYSQPQSSYQTSTEFYRGDAATPLLPGDTFSYTVTQTRSQPRQHHRASSSSGSSLPVVTAAAEYDEADQYALQLLAYRSIYVLQGAFMGMLGPALVFFSQLAQEQSGLAAPVYGFGPIFAAHGGAALVMSFMSDFVLTYFTEKEFMKQLIVVLLLCSGAWYACLTPVAAATGNVGVDLYFIAKGFWTALLNITLNRCSLWIAGEKDQRRRSIITSMNINYGLGCVLGAIVALVLTKLDIDLGYAFFGLAIMTVFPAVLVATLPSPCSYYGRDEHQTLLSFEDPTRRVPTVPSPIVGGVFLHAMHISGSKNCNPDTYDSKNNFIILLVTIFATVLFGIQLGLAAFLYDYIGTVLREGTKLASKASGSGSAEVGDESNETVWQCAAMVLFWGSLTVSYIVLPRVLYHDKNLYSIVVCAVVCGASSFGLLFGAEAGLITFTVCLFLFSSALAPLFTLSIHCLTRVINEQLIRRVSSLIVFGCGMGEVFIPVLMGFFMSGQSGQANGAVAVSYITFILAITVVGVSGMLLWMVKARLKELPEPLDELEGNSEMGRMRAARAGHDARKNNHY